MQETAIRTIAVTGGGVAALSAAIAFARALPQTLVTIVETSNDPGALVDIVPTAWPTITPFHAAIGIDERDLVKSGIAIHHLGTMFDNWSPSGAPWVHAFGHYGKPAGGTPFDQLWYRAFEEGEALPYDRYSVGAALARAGKFVHPAREPDSLGSRFHYGLRLDLLRYRERLKEHAKNCGIKIVPGELGSVEAKESGVTALLLVDGSKLEADLFIDCTGPAALILSALDESVEDWSAWMPFDRLLLRNKDTSEPPSTAERVRVSDDGWEVEWPLEGRQILASMTIGGEGLPVSRGRRLRPWMHNVLAIGDSSIMLDPLHGMNLYLTHHSILLALELLPSRAFSSVETGEYNRRFEQVTRRVRDFLALHYHCCGRGSGGWKLSQDAEVPDSLMRTIDQYGYRGRLPFHEEEIVSRDSWTAALLGMGIMPRHVDPVSAGVPMSVAKQRMRELALQIDATVAKLPSYVDYLGR